MKYIHERTNSFTIAFVIQNEQIIFGLAKCHTKDNFSKKKGRLIAEGRLHKSPIILSYNPTKTFQDNMKTLMAFITDCVVESVKSGKFSYSDVKERLNKERGIVISIK